VEEGRRGEEHQEGGRRDFGAARCRSLARKRQNEGEPLWGDPSARPLSFLSSLPRRPGLGPLPGVMRAGVYASVSVCAHATGKRAVTTTPTLRMPKKRKTGQQRGRLTTSVPCTWGQVCGIDGLHVRVKDGSGGERPCAGLGRALSLCCSRGGPRSGSERWALSPRPSSLPRFPFPLLTIAAPRPRTTMRPPLAPGSSGRPHPGASGSGAGPSSSSSPPTPTVSPATLVALAGRALLGAALGFSGVALVLRIMAGLGPEGLVRVFEDRE
jgi:hypothetical protein